MKSIFFVLLCVVSWAFIPVVSRFGQSSLDNYQFLFWSSILSFAVLFLSTIFSGTFKVFSMYHLHTWIQAVLLGFMGSFLYYLLLYYAYAHADGLEVIALQYTWPILIVIFSIIFLKEKVTYKSLLASMLGFLGVLFVLTKGDLHQIHLDNIGVNGIVLTAASVFALFSVLSKKCNLEPFTGTTIFFLSASVCSLIAMSMFSHFAVPSFSTIVPLIVNGVIINGLSYVFWLKALRFSNASFIAPFVFLTPVLASLLVILFFKETFLPVYFVGMGLVILSGLLSQS